MYLAWLQSSTRELQWLEYLKLVFLELPNVTTLHLVIREIPNERSAIQCVRGARSSIQHYIQAPPPMDLVRVESNMSLEDDPRRQFCYRLKFFKNIVGILFWRESQMMTNDYLRVNS